MSVLGRRSRIFVAGHRGLVGSALVRRLLDEGHTQLITRTRAELDLRDQAAVEAFFATENIDFVFLAAATVGGVAANTRRQADFLYDNLMIAANVIRAAAVHECRKLLFLGSSCVYPRQAPQPIREDSLLTGALEPTNEGYAIAKIAGLKLCEMYQRQYAKSFISAMPTNLYGPGDNFDHLDSHVIPALLRRFHDGRRDRTPEVVVWGSGEPRREFLHVDDLTRALYLLMNEYNAPETINVGTGVDCSIRELAGTIAEVTGYEGRIVFDTSKPDGTPRKLLDVSRINAIGWHSSVPLREGLESTYRWALAHGAFGEEDRKWT